MKSRAAPAASMAREEASSRKPARLTGRSDQKAASAQVIIQASQRAAMAELMVMACMIRAFRHAMQAPIQSRFGCGGKNVVKRLRR
jgi:hypothetical protein